MSNIKVVHTGDAHIDHSTHGTINPKTGLSTAWESNRDALASGVQAAIDHNADVFLHDGDGFAHGVPSQEAVLMFAETLAPLLKANIPVVLIGGNHENLRVQPTQRTATATVGAILKQLGEVHVVEREPALIRLNNGLQVAGLPWLSKSSILSRLGLERLDPAEGDMKVVRYGLDAIEQMVAAADASSPLIFASHCTVDDVRVDSISKGHKRASELDITHLFAEPILPRKVLDEAPFSYVALSHIHARQSMGSKCHYAGSPNRLTLTDADDPKSVNLVTISGDNELVSVDFLNTDARKMHSINLAAPDAEARLDALGEGALVGLILPPGEAAIPDDILRKLRSAGASVIDTKAVPVDRPRQVVVTLPETVSPVAALDTWLSAKRPDADASLVKSLAHGLIGKAS